MNQPVKSFRQHQHADLVSAVAEAVDHVALVQSASVRDFTRLLDVTPPHNETTTLMVTDEENGRVVRLVQLRVNPSRSLFEVSYYDVQTAAL